MNPGDAERPTFVPKPEALGSSNRYGAFRGAIQDKTQTRTLRMIGIARFYSTVPPSCRELVELALPLQHP
jgi:hypothetical protein